MNMILKKEITRIAITALLLAFYGSQTINAQTLVLWHANGTTTDVDLASLPKVTFEKDKVLITSTILDMEYPKQDILKFTYKKESTGISDVMNNGKYTQKDGELVFHGVKPTDAIALYNVKGIRVPANIIRKGNNATLPLHHLPSGVYLLNVNGKTSKFMKK